MLGQVAMWVIPVLNTTTYAVSTFCHALGPSWYAPNATLVHGILWG